MMNVDSYASANTTKFLAKPDHARLRYLAMTSWLLPLGGLLLSIYLRVASDSLTYTWILGLIASFAGLSVAMVCWALSVRFQRLAWHSLAGLIVGALLVCETFGQVMAMALVSKARETANRTILEREEHWKEKDRNFTKMQRDYQQTKLKHCMTP